MDDISPELRRAMYGTNDPPLGSEMWFVNLQAGRPQYIPAIRTTLVPFKTGTGMGVNALFGDVRDRPDLTKRE